MNFVVFNPDELRAESVSCYGHPFVKTPNIDRLAEEGVKFENCFVQNPVCTPSRCSFMTGLYVHNSGHRSLWNLLKSYEPNLLKYLKKSGYDVAWYGKNDLLAEESFEESVTYTENFSNPGGKNYYKRGEKSLKDFYTFLAEPFDRIEDSIDYLYVKRGCEFIEAEHKKPFFLFLPIGKPHPPYTAPKEFYNLYDKFNIDYLRPEKNNAPLFHSYIKEYRELNSQNDDLFKKIQSVYLASISYVDYLLGMVIDSIERAGLSDDTAIIFFSDHGDYAGDYKLVEKWPNGMEDVLTRVPFIISVPGNKKGTSVKEPVELFDFFATVMELAGVEATHHHFSKSLVKQLYGEPADPERYVFCEGGYDINQDDECFEGNPRFSDGLLNKESIYYPKAIVQQEHPESVCRTVMIRNLKYKYVKRTSGENELYLLDNDPREINNVYEQYKDSDLIKSLESELLNWYLKTADTISFDRDARNKPENFVRKF